MKRSRRQSRDTSLSLKSHPQPVGLFFVDPTIPFLRYNFSGLLMNVTVFTLLFLACLFGVGVLGAQLGGAISIDRHFTLYANSRTASNGFGFKYSTTRTPSHYSLY